MRTHFAGLLFLFSMLGCMLTGAQDHPYLLNQQLYKHAPTALGIAGNGEYLLAGFHDGSIRQFRSAGLEEIVIIKDAHFKAVHAIGASPENAIILSAGHKEITLRDTSLSPISIWSRHNTSIWNARISADGNYLVSSAINKTFLLWDLKQGAFLQGMKAHSDVCMAVAISPDSRMIASAAKDQRILLWDMESREIRFELHGPSMDVYDLKFSPCGRRLVAASKEKNIRVYDLEEQKLEKLLSGHKDRVLEVEFSPDGRYLVSGSADGSILLWDIESGKIEYRYPAAEAAVLDLEMHPDGRSFYSAAFSGALSHWSIDPEIFARNYYGPQLDSALSLSPLMDPRREDENRKSYQLRLDSAGLYRMEVIDSLYHLYLEQR